MNKNVLLLGAGMMLMGTTAPMQRLYAHEPVGADAIELNNENTSGTSTVDHIYTNAAGEIFFIGNAASVGAEPTATFGEITTATAPFRAKMSQSNNNFAFGMYNADGELQGFGTSDRGNLKSSAAVATDKGLYMAITTCHSDSNYQADNQFIRLNYSAANDKKSTLGLSGAYTAGKAVEYGAIFQLSADTLESRCQFGQINGQTAGFSFLDLTTDGTHFYLLTLLTKGIAIGKDTLKATNASSLAILKFDADWHYVGSVISEGTVAQKTGKLQYANQKLYYTGNFTAQANGTFSFGGKTLTTTNALSGILLATIGTDLSCESLSFTEAYKNAEGKGGTVTVYDELIHNDTAYLTGFFNGKFAYGTADTIACTATRAFLLKIDLTTGKTTRAAMLASSGFTQGKNVLAYNDSIYLYAYDWGSNERISLYQFDQNLQAGDTLKLIRSEAMTATFGAAITTKGLLAYGFRTNKEITYLADQSTYTPADGKFRGIVAIERLAPKEDTANEQVTAPERKAVKLLRNGQLYIQKGEQLYNAQGQAL